MSISAPVQEKRSKYVGCITSGIIISLIRRVREKICIVNELSVLEYLKAGRFVPKPHCPSGLPFWPQRSGKKLIHFNLSRSGRHTKSSSFQSGINWQFFSRGSALKPNGSVQHSADEIFQRISFVSEVKDARPKSRP